MATKASCLFVKLCFSPSLYSGCSPKNNGHPRWSDVQPVSATLGTARWDLSHETPRVSRSYSSKPANQMLEGMSVFFFVFFFPPVSALLFFFFFFRFSSKINDIVMATYRVMKSKLPSTLQSMSLYLANRDTEFILFKPVRVGGQNTRV